MSKKYKTKVELVPWMSARPDNVENRFIQVGNSLLFISACLWKALVSANSSSHKQPPKNIRFPRPVCGVMLMNWKPKALSRSTPVRQRGNPTYMNFATTGRLPLAPGLAPLPWLYRVNLPQIESRKIFKKSHWLCRFG